MKPLEHVTILDLSRVLACPFATMILAELGARVIKVEQPGAATRPAASSRSQRRGATESAYYFACNRSKQSITVNLRSAEGQTMIRDLARKADVVLENFPVGTLKRYGLDYAAFRPSTRASSTSRAPASARAARLRIAKATTPCSRRWVAS